MKPKTIENLQYFVGKVCSIVTTSMNRSFDERISREHFVVVVQTIDIDGIWGSHPYNPDLVSYFSLEHVISIHQEEVIDPSKPEHAEMIKEYEQKTGKSIKGDLKNSPPVAPKPKELLPVLKETSPVSDNSNTGDAIFVDIESLERLAEDSRRAFSQYDSFDLRPKT